MYMCVIIFQNIKKKVFASGKFHSVFGEAYCFGSEVVKVVEKSYFYDRHL